MCRLLPVLLIGACTLVLSDTSATAEVVQQGAVSSIERFSGPLSLGKARKGVVVNYKTLSLAPGARIETLPSADKDPARRGLIVFELRAGKLTTVINDDRQERREGEFWVAEIGQAIVLEADDDSVVVETIEIIGF